jgi:hypothetical protein
VVDLSSHNTNPPGVLDGEVVPLKDMAENRRVEVIVAVRGFVEDHCCLPSAKSWTEARMSPSEKTIRRRFGSFRQAIERACTGWPGLTTDRRTTALGSAVAAPQDHRGHPAQR